MMLPLLPASDTDAIDPRDDAPASLDRLRRWLALQRVAAYAPARARRLLERGASPEAALAALLGATPEPALGARELTTTRRVLAEAGVRLVPFGSAPYPERIAGLVDAPALLAVRGVCEVLTLPAVAIVGARVPTRLGRELAFTLARDLASCGVVVVSGLARGIDAAAHRGALDARGATVAILGCGPDLVYPSEHRGLADEIARRGAIVSELPPGAPPAKHHFPLRNRLISALARAVVIVEARVRSGSLVTARHAADQGREVMAVPGAVGAATSEGPNQLLRAGAWPVLDASDVLAAIGLGPATPAERASRGAPDAARVASARAHAPARETSRWDGHPVVRALRHEPQARDELAASLGWSAQQLARELALLELEGVLAEERDGRLRVADPRTG